MSIGKIEVSTMAQRNVIRDLQNDNQQFQQRVSDLKAKEQELSAMWKGESNTAFRQAFTTDAAAWDKFHTLVEQYIQGLEKIAQIYDKAESENVNIARTRTV